VLIKFAAARTSAGEGKAQGAPFCVKKDEFLKTIDLSKGSFETGSRTRPGDAGVTGRSSRSGAIVVLLKCDVADDTKDLAHTS